MKNERYYIVNEIKYFFKSLPYLTDTPWYHWIPTCLALIAGFLSIMILIFSPPVYKANCLWGALVTVILFCISVFTRTDK